MQQPLIRTQSLCKTFLLGRERVNALSDVSISVDRGEICAVLGTSGSGKSTLLNMLAGLEKPTSGSVFIGKHRIDSMTERELALFRRRFTGFIFQSYDLIPSLTALENVALPLVFKGEDRRQREEKALRMLRLVGLENRKDHRPFEMSGGQQQRVGIARAFVSEPKVIFADEPTGNLDSETTASVMRLMRETVHKNGATMILVTHDNDVAAFADKIITITDGRVQSTRKNTPAAENDNEEK